MKIMVVGGGGREHAVIKALKKNPEVSEIVALPGNGGIAADAVCVPVGATDLEGLVKYACDNGVDFAVVTPDDPLVMGAVDLLEEAGIPCFGPNKNAAILEGSKVFSKNLLPLARAFSSPRPVRRRSKQSRPSWKTKNSVPAAIRS